MPQNNFRKVWWQSPYCQREVIHICDKMIIYFRLVNSFAICGFLFNHDTLNKGNIIGRKRDIVTVLIKTILKEAT